MHVDGRCHCGAIAFAAEIDPGRASICHCTDCQRFSSAPYRASVPAAAADFRLLKGRPKIYVKTADSGAKRAQAFCETCGTPIYSSGVESPSVFNLRLGTLEQRAEIAPRRQKWRSSALGWADDVKSSPALAKE